MVDYSLTRLSRIAVGDKFKAKYNILQGALAVDVAGLK